MATRFTFEKIIESYRNFSLKKYLWKELKGLLLLLIYVVIFAVFVMAAALWGQTVFGNKLAFHDSAVFSQFPKGMFLALFVEASVKLDLLGLIISLSFFERFMRRGQNSPIVWVMTALIATAVNVLTLYAIGIGEIMQFCTIAMMIASVPAGFVMWLLLCKPSRLSSHFKRLLPPKA